VRNFDLKFARGGVVVAAQCSFEQPENVGSWPVATNFSLGPDVSFRGEAEVGRAAEPLPRSKMTQRRH